MTPAATRTLALSAAVLLASCGSSSDDGAESVTAATSGSDQHQITTLVQDYMGNPDTGKCDRVLTDRYLRQNWSGSTVAEAKADCKRRPPFPSSKATKVTVDGIRVQGDTATARGHSAKGRTYELDLRKQGGVWKIDLAGPA